MISSILCGDAATSIPLYVAVVGYVGTCITSACFLPQFITVIKTKKTSDLSFFMWLLELVGGSLWIIYAVLVGNAFDFTQITAWLPTLIVNAFVFVFSLPIFIIKVMNMCKAKKLGITEEVFEERQIQKKKKK